MENRNYFSEVLIKCGVVMVLMIAGVVKIFSTVIEGVSARKKAEETGDATRRSASPAMSWAPGDRQ